MTGTNQNPEVIQKLLTEMPRALSTYGTPAHRLEEAMTLCADRLGVSAGFFAMPTAVICTIGEGDAARTHVVRVSPGEVDLCKLDRVDAAMGRLLRGEWGAAQALEEIHAIRAAPRRYPVLLTVACFGVASGGAAQFFAGSWVDAGVSAVLGIVVGWFAVFAQERRDLARLTDFLAGAVVAAVAALLGGRIGGATPAIISVSSLIFLFPGLTLTTAIHELATKNLIAGTARLMGALMVLLSIGFGVGVGQVAMARWTQPPVPGTPIPLAVEPGAILIVPLALVVLFRARLRDAVVIVPTAALGYYAARLGTIWAGPELGAGFGAFLVGLAGNWYARVSRRPTAITLVPGVMLLVPGVVGFRSVSSFLAHDAVAGVETAFSMVIAATGIVIGLMLANVLVRSKQSL